MIGRTEHYWLGMVALALLVGCFANPDHPPTYPVTGTVLSDGKPLEKAEVTFLPKQGGPNARPARGRTDQHGRFRLRTYFGPSDDTNGALVGQYMVTIRKVDVPQGVIDPEDQKPPQNQLPERYGNPQQSGLSATVTEDGDNTFEFSLPAANSISRAVQCNYHQNDFETHERLP